MIRHQVQFCRSADGTIIAFSVIGRGPPLLIVTGFGHHLELDLTCPVSSPAILALAKSFSVVRFDARGFGLSQRDVAEHSVGSQVEDVKAVIAATGLKSVPKGLDNAQIAARLRISEKTTRNHMTRIYAKLGVENR